MRWIALLFLLVGCVQPTYQDIPAPEPTDDFADPEPFDPAGMPWVTGSLADTRGVSQRGLVWMETIDLREPINNVAAYRTAKAHEQVEADGAFGLRVEGEAYHLVADVPGKRLYRSASTFQSHYDVVVGDVFPVIAHRGASFYAPENTLASLEKAALLGATSVEADVRLSGDGRLVIMHDETLERTTGDPRYVHLTHAADMYALEAGSWFDPSFADQRVPSLQQFLDAAAANDVRLLLDVKAPSHLREETWTRVLAVVAAAGAQDRVTFASFYRGGMEACVSWPGMTCLWLRSQDGDLYTWLDQAAALGVDWVSLRAGMLSRDLVDHAHRHGLLVQAMTTNHPEWWQQFLAMGVDGIGTDRMGYLVDHLNGVPVPYVP